MLRVLAPSALLLIAANLVPLAGVLLWQWDLFLLLMLYWCETAVIGFWMAVGAMLRPPDGMHRAGVALLTAFFAVHAGGFMAGHFVFLWGLFSGPWRGELHGIGDFVRLVIFESGLWVPLTIMFAVRGVTTLFDVRRWWSGADAGAMPPHSARTGADTGIYAFYARIVTMHVSIVFGAVLMQKIGTLAPLLILIALKITIDLGFDAYARLQHAPAPAGRRQPDPAAS